MKFHYRSVDRLKNKYRKLEQAQSRRSYQETNQSSRKAPARNRNTSEDTNEKELAKVLKAKIREVETSLEQMPGAGGYSHTLPIRVCVAQRDCDFEAPDLERCIHFRGVF